MNANAVTNAFWAVITILAASWVSQAQSNPKNSPGVPRAAAKPLLLEKNEGEQRTWRDLPPGEFMLKVSPKNNGSQHLVLGTEDILPGDDIPLHKHLGQDEIVLIHTGTAHVRVGDQERDLHSGGMAFIPAYTWVSVKNTGVEPVSMTFIFSAPGFEKLMRCESVPENEKPTPITPAEMRHCEHEGHVIYKDVAENPKK